MLYAYRHRLAVRFRDCDAMGHVNHAVYFTYLEQCRLTFWREVTGAASPHTRVIVARAECDYRAPAFFGDDLEIALTVGEIGQSSFVLAYEIANAANGRSIAVGRTVMVCYDYDAGKSIPLPPATRDLLERLRSDTRPAGAPAIGGRTRVGPGSDPEGVRGRAAVIADCKKRC